MTPLDAEKVRLLKAARELVLRARSFDRERYICVALSEAHARIKTARSYDARRQLHGLIKCRLGERNNTLAHWLEDMHGIIVRPGKDHARLQATRAAWINSLIEEFGGTP